MELTIERILPGGLGLAHAEGKTVMVSLAAPGDRLRVQMDREKGDVCFASIIEVIEPSALRVEPPCPYFGSCGGCDFQQMSYQAQLEAKLEIVRDCLHRIAKLESLPDLEIIPAPNQWQYRSRAQWQYDPEQKRLGYFESASRRVCDVVECAVLVPELQRQLEQLRQRMADDSLPARARHFRAVLGDEGVVVSPGVSSPSVSEDNLHDIRRSINGEVYFLNAGSFFQTNVDLLSQLMDAAIGDASGRTAIELYCGVGLFTLPLARRFSRIIGVEENPDAVGFARQNLATAGLTNAEVVAANVGVWLEKLTRPATAKPGLERKRPRLQPPGSESPALASVTLALQSVAHPDFLLLDPPRTGAQSRVVDGILQLRPKRICYVSCDPATLARDLRKIIAGGYSLDSLMAFDMFPQTHHVETIAKLSGP